jgi:uncharacterized protein (TIGR03437 family)
MRISIRLCILTLPLALLRAQTGSSDPAGVLGQLAVARLAGSGNDSIQAMTSGAAGNLYIAGTTSSVDFPVKNAMQPEIGEAPLTRSLDGGLTWQRMGSPPVLPREIAPHPSDPQTFLTGGLDGIYKTSDGGQTWRHVYTWDPPNSTVPEVLEIAIDPANPRFAYAHVAISTPFLASTDGGDTWQVRTPPVPGTVNWFGARQLWVDPRGSGAVALGLSLSRDHGLTWTAMTSPPAGTPTFTVPDRQHSGWVYAATAATTRGYLYLSTDWGTTWIDRAQPAYWEIESLLVDPDLPNILYASANGTLYVSDDGAASWHAAGAGPYGNLAYLSRQCMGGALLVVSGGHVVSSPDFGASFQPTQLTRVLAVVTGPGCAVYAVRSFMSDAFITKLSPDGEVLWSTFLGGADRDASVAIALDGKGNVYVTGNTSSTDFPTTAPRVGQQGQQNIFAAKLDADGNLLYSVVLGGELSDTVTALAVDSGGDVHLVGRTTSKSFPATPGAFQTQAGAGNNGFAVKLGPDGQIIYSSYLQNIRLANPLNPFFFSTVPVAPVSVAVEAGGSALIAAYGTTLSRMSSDGSTLTAASVMPGQIYTMETDSQGDIYVAGQTSGSPSSSGVCFYAGIYHQNVYLPSGDIFVVKLRPGGLDQVYSTRLFGDCGSSPGAIKVGATGEVTLGMWTYAGFALRNPVLASSPACTFNGHAAVSRLSADGSALLFSSELDMCASAPAIALGQDDSLYTGVTGGPAYLRPIHGAVLHLPVLPPTVMSVDAIYHAFTGSQGRVAPGVPLTIGGQGLSLESIDLGLNDPDPLPPQLGGVQVLFDGSPAEMFQVAPDHLICVPPAGIKGKNWATVQVINSSDSGTPFLVHVNDPLIGLLTRSFPSPPRSKPDGNIRNEDGTPNDADHPTALGSTVTLFATGVSEPGRVALYWAPPPYVPNPLPSPFPTGPTPVYGTAEAMPGFIRALYQIEFKIPDALGPGVQYLPQPGVVTRVEIEFGNTVGVYVK